MHAVAAKGLASKTYMKDSRPDGFNRSYGDCNNPVTRRGQTGGYQSAKSPDGEKYMKRIAGVSVVTLALAMVATVLVHAALSINGAGASFPYPMYSKWFSEYQKKNPEVQINYQSIGSGGGIKQVTEGTVDFGASDGPMNDEEFKAIQVKHGFGTLRFPTALGPLVPTDNI